MIGVGGPLMLMYTGTTTERRKHERFFAVDGYALIPTPSIPICGKILDFSKGGLAFRYQAIDQLLQEKVVERTFDLGIYSASGSRIVDPIQCQIVSDRELPERSACGQIVKRRCSMRFQTLSQEQFQQCDQYIRQFTRTNGGTDTLEHTGRELPLANGLTRSVLLVSETGSQDLTTGLANIDYPLLITKFADAPRFFNAADFKLILLDCADDPAGGLQRLQQLKSIWPAAPVIFISSKSSEEIILQTFRLGAKDFFKKPLNIFQFRKTIACLLDAAGPADNGDHRPIMINSLEPVEAYSKAPADLPDSILKAIHYMEGNLSSEVYLDTMAEIAGMSKFHFSRLFRKHMGVPPMHFFILMRLGRAKIQLENSVSRIGAISEMVGFNDLSNFNKWFKRVYGVTPSKYRKLARQRV